MINSDFMLLLKHDARCAKKKKKKGYVKIKCDLYQLLNRVKKVKKHIKEI